MPADALPDYTAESRVVQIAAADLVTMRESNADYIDGPGTLGLGAGDLIRMSLPKFQRGLKWNQEKVSNFHLSLIQGWPIGVIVIAVERSSVINRSNGQRRHDLSLIDGQQRAWALRELIKTFWSQPRFLYTNEKWEEAQPAAGSIVASGKALRALADAVQLGMQELEGLVCKLSQSTEGKVFDDYMGLLDGLVEQGIDPNLGNSKAAREPASSLCSALKAQFDDLRRVPVHALILGESLASQLPTIFRRLNEGIPLRGYDLLAAMWDSTRLAPAKGKMTQKKHELVKAILATAEQRIESTYEKVDSGYDQDPNTEALELKDVSLFDFLYFLGSRMVDGNTTFSLNSDALAFQTAALTLRGSIAHVDDQLRSAVPLASDGTPDIERLTSLFQEATKSITLALKHLMDVHVSTVQLKGRLGLTTTVVYTSVLLSHQHVVRKDGTRLKIDSRSASVQDRQITPGVYKTSQERHELLKQNMPLWYVHDSLTSAFAGSRAYELAMNRVWQDFRGSKTTPELQVSNVMFEQPKLEAMLRIFELLWRSESDISTTPQRRRISETGSVLYRAAFAHGSPTDAAIDHVLAFQKGKVAAKKLGEALPLNHVANLMPLAEVVNSKRGDAEWCTYLDAITPAQRIDVEKVLLVPKSSCVDSHFASKKEFTQFLRLRYRAMVDQALENLRCEEWKLLTRTQRDEQLLKIANS